MELKQNPFSFYDFLGYFTPGAIFVYSFVVMSIHSESTYFSLANIEQSTGFGKADLYVPFVLLSYTIGHLLSYLSSITIERYAIWALGYPSKYLLGLDPEGYFGMTENKKARIVIRSLVFILLIPISIFDFFIGKLCGMRALYAKRLDSLLVNIIVGKIDPLLKDHAGLVSLEDHGDAKETNFFLYAYHYCVENSPNHLPKMQNYVALYGFLRTITFLSVIGFWVFCWQLTSHSFSQTQSAFIALSIALACYSFFVGFVKFYGRFSLEALMALSVTYPKPNKTRKVLDGNVEPLIR